MCVVKVAVCVVVQQNRAGLISAALFGSPRSSGLQHRWVQFGLALPSDASGGSALSVGTRMRGNLCFCCGWITGQQSHTQTCINKSRHVIG